MAVMAIFTGNINKSQYEALRKEVNWGTAAFCWWRTSCRQFRRFRAHLCGGIWESAEAMNAFVEKQLAPAFQKLRIAPPDVAVYPARNINAFKAIDEYKI